MKRKTTDVPSKIWSFGALRPTENESLLLDQLFEAHKYYNTLIEIERRRRSRFREVRAEIVPDLAVLEKEHEALMESFRMAKVALPKQKPIDGKRPARQQLPPELIEIRDKRKALEPRIKELRERFNANAGAQDRVKLIDSEAHAASVAARENSAANWGTRGLIDAQVMQAKSGRIDPEFKRRFTGQGRVGVQLQAKRAGSHKGCTVSDLLSCTDTRLQLHMAEPPTRKNRRATHHGHRIRIRIGSTEESKPIWATLPVIIHRQLPSDSLIKWAWIKISKIGGQRRYELQLTLESETFREHHPGRGTVAINFGWRGNDDGSKRVAYLVDDSGNDRSFDVPASVENTLTLADKLRSANDLHFDAARDVLIQFMAKHETDEWLKENTQHIDKWRSHRRLVTVARHLAEQHLQEELRLDRARNGPFRNWRRERLASKRDLFASYEEISAWSGKSGMIGLAFYLELWRRKNQHLWQWESNARETARRRRKDLFRRWAREINHTYTKILIEKFDLRTMAEKPGPAGESRPKKFRSDRAIASPGEFRQLIVSVAKQKVATLPAHNKTVSCFLCGYINERALTHRMVCAGCNREWDQDANNCRNQLAGEGTASAAE